MTLSVADLRKLFEKPQSRFSTVRDHLGPNGRYTDFFEKYLRSDELAVAPRPGDPSVGFDSARLLISGIASVEGIAESCDVEVRYLSDKKGVLVVGVEVQISLGQGKWLVEHPMGSLSMAFLNDLGFTQARAVLEVRGGDRDRPLLYGAVEFTFGSTWVVKVAPTEEGVCQAFADFSGLSLNGDLKALRELPIFREIADSDLKLDGIPVISQIELTHISGSFYTDGKGNPLRSLSADVALPSIKEWPVKDVFQVQSVMVRLSVSFTDGRASVALRLDVAGKIFGVTTRGWVSYPSLDFGGGVRPRVAETLVTPGGTDDFPSGVDPKKAKTSQVGFTGNAKTGAYQVDASLGDLGWQITMDVALREFQLRLAGTGTSVPDVTASGMLDIGGHTLAITGQRSKQTGQQATWELSADLLLMRTAAGGSPGLYMMFSGTVVKDSGLRVLASWSSEEGVSFADFADLFGIDVSDWPDGFVPTLMSLSVLYQTGKSQNGTVFTGEITVGSIPLRFVLAALPGQTKGSTMYAWLGEAVLVLGLSALPIVGTHVPVDADVGVRSLALVGSSALLTRQRVEQLNVMISAAWSHSRPAPELPVRDLRGSVVVVTLQVPGMTGDALKQVIPLGTRPPTARQPVRRATRRSIPALRGAGGGFPIAWIEVRRGVGPLFVHRIGATYTGGNVVVLVDASLAAVGMSLGVEGLQLGIPLTQPFTPSVVLRGLSVSYSRPPVGIAGMFVNRPPNEAYELLVEGGVVVTSPALSITGAGVYTRLRAGFTSLFVFGSLTAAKGRGVGPTEFRVIGVAGGVGYNSTLRLPPPDKVYQFPLVAGAATGNLEGSGPLDVLKTLTDSTSAEPWVRPQDGQYWFAAGITATTYEFIRSTLMVVVEFGTDFTIGLVGVAVATFPRVVGAGPVYAMIELQVLAQYQSRYGVLKLAASLTRNSYLIDPACRLQGGMAFSLWVAGDHAGDFVFTLGGYNRDFRAPERYPVVPRLGYTWSAGNAVSIRGEAYCALTPSAFMVGTRLEINAYTDGCWGYAKAWLHAGMDAMIQWNPFHFAVSIDISVGFEVKALFYKHGEIGVSLHLWGPPTGGEATLHLPFGIDFTVPFGEPAKPPDQERLTWTQFQAAQLPPAQQRLRIDAVTGLLPGPEEQITVRSETVTRWAVSGHGFTFTTSCVVPASELTVNGEPWDTGQPEKKLDIRPMRASGLVSKHEVTIKRGTASVDLTDWTIETSRANVPQALWGPPLPDGKPPLPVAGKELVCDQVTGLRFTVPSATLAENPLRVAKDALKVEPMADRTLPTPVPETSQVVRWKPDDPSVVAAIAANIATPDIAASRTCLGDAMTRFGINPGTDDDLKSFAGHVGKLFDAEPMYVPTTAGES